MVYRATFGFVCKVTVKVIRTREIMYSVFAPFVLPLLSLLWKCWIKGCKLRAQCPVGVNESPAALLTLSRNLQEAVVTGGLSSRTCLEGRKDFEKFSLSRSVRISPTSSHGPFGNVFLFFRPAWSPKPFPTACMTFTFSRWGLSVFISVVIKLFIYCK
jgi:hypothetical protein